MTNLPILPVFPDHETLVDEYIKYFGAKGIEAAYNRTLGCITVFGPKSGTPRRYSITSDGRFVFRRY